MKIIKKELNKNRITFRLEIADDLYYLADILTKGDRAISKTKRRMEERQGVERAERSEKELVTLEIEVETVEFDRTVDRLRVSGKICQGPESVPTGDFHTLNFVPGMVLTITKEFWGTADLLKVEDAAKAIRAKVLLLAIEDGLCSFGLLRDYGIKLAGTISHSLSGKREPEKKRAEEVVLVVINEM